MKTLRYISIMLLMAVTMMTAATASAQSLRDGEYNYIGKISPNGTVRNDKYVAIGFFNTDGTVANKQGEVTGLLGNDLNIYDTNGVRIGYLTIDGSVNDGESNLLGSIDRASGKVTDKDGKVIGYAHGVSMLRIAAYYFFDFFDK